MSEIINTPTIGRRVWYWPSVQDVQEGMRVIYSDQSFDAGISCVHSKNLVNLDICDHRNERHGREAVALLQADDERAGKPGTAQWMPYQAAQAKKQAAAPAVAAPVPVRMLDSHIVNPANDRLQVSVEDEPGAGGANHLYMIRGFNTATNPSDPFVARHGSPSEHATILFQNGPIAEAGVNGVTHEVLLAIIADRLQSFQAGPYANSFNAIALEHVLEAQAALQTRTRERMARGVEGTHKV